LDQLRPPDLAKEEETFGIVSAHHCALQKLSSYLKTALWEETSEAVPKWYSTVSHLFEWPKVQLGYLFEWAREVCDRALDYLYADRGFKVSIAEPDKLTIKHASDRNSVARFLMHQKPRAIRGLAKRIQDETTSQEAREHALRTLAAITGRQFHLHNIEHARSWLTQRGQ